MKFLPLVFLLLPFLFSCNSKIREQNKLAITFSENLEAVSLKMKNYNSNIYHVFDEKLLDPATVEKARFYQPKMELISEYSKQAIFYIDSMKYLLIKEAGGRDNLMNASNEVINKAVIANKSAEKLYDKLVNYKKDVLSIDERLSDFSKFMVVASTEFDTMKHSKELFVKFFFAKSSVATVFAYLNSFKVSVLNTENMCAEYFNSRIYKHGIHDTFYEPILGLSSTVIQQNEKMKITAGIGSFSIMGKPRLEIFNKQIEPNETGVMEYEFRETRKPGKYFLPVKISYTDQDGKSMTRETTISYTVLPANND
jgi:hypothetical protein